jgi:predicted HicB family RNase H-like nuclease
MDSDNNLLHYNGYTGSVSFDEETNTYFGQVLYITDAVLYNGKTIPELQKEFEEAIEFYITTCLYYNTEPNNPTN